MAKNRCLKIVLSPYFSEISDSGEILYAKVDQDNSENPATEVKNFKFKMVDRGHIGKRWFWT